MSGLRRDLEKGSAYELDYEEFSRRIIKETGREFLFIEQFPFRKKVRFVVSWFFPRCMI